MMHDHYAVLGLSPSAAQQEIENAYKRLRFELHPDRHQTDAAKQEAADRFRQVTEARRVLGDPVKRAEYDLQRFRPGAEPQIDPATEIERAMRQAEEIAGAAAEEMIEVAADAVKRGFSALLRRARGRR